VFQFQLIDMADCRNLYCVSRIVRAGYFENKILRFWSQYRCSCMVSLSGHNLLSSGEWGLKSKAFV